MATSEMNVQQSSRSAKRRIARAKFKNRLFNLGVGLDVPLLIIVLTLLAIGLVMLFSASFPAALYYKGNSYFYIAKQAEFAVAGIVAMLLISVVDYHQIQRWRYVLFIITILLLVLVFVPGIGVSSGGATRWIYIFGVSFQPSEIAKFTLVVMLAGVIAKVGEGVRTFKHGVLPCLIPIAAIVGLVILEKHVSASVILLAIAATVMFVGGIKFRWFALVGGIAGAVILYIVFFSEQFTYALNRVLGWIDPFNPPDDVNTYQTLQSLYAIGSGQILGVGLGQSTQKYLYLPEARNDFIFAVVCEELGFVGAAIVILMFVALLWRGLVISMNARDKFGTLLGVGITCTIAIQAALNICVVSNAIPNTGISLPFFSYGGTSLLVLLGEMGVLLSISRNSYVEKT